MTSEPRLDLRVVARFLDALVGPDGATRPLSRSRLQLAARVNYDIYRTYEAALVGRGLMTLDAEAALVTVTPRGAEVRTRLLRLLADVLGSGSL
jgi:hypothetical protein